MPPPHGATDPTDCPRYVALTHDGEVIEADDALAVVLDALAAGHEADGEEELVVWRDGQAVAAVFHSNGTVTAFEGVEAAQPRRRR